MAVKLPQAFIGKMERLLGQDFESFMASYNQPRYYGLRSNPLKISKTQFEAISPFSLRPVPWAAEGFYYSLGDRPGKHPYYHAGLYYIQEPSAMAPVELLEVEPGDRVLDLCAAPGGKSTQIAGKLGGYGLLVSNDNQAERIKPLIKNLAVYGVRNAVVTHATPDRLLPAFAGYFNKIVIDAPCSGEGMFRKDEDMAGSWESHSVEKCALMQKEILHTAAKLLSPGGRIVYSTCTFSPEENEATIARFLDNHPHYQVVPVVGKTLFSSGQPSWINGEQYAVEEQFSKFAVASVADTYRLWPHRLEGEGHYVAVLQHDGTVEDEGAAERNPFESASANRKTSRGRKEKHQERPALARDLSLWLTFMQEQLVSPIEGKWVCFGDHVYWTDPDWELPELSGISVVRPGWFVGTLKKNRFEPSPALAMGLQLADAVRSVNLSADSPEVIRYLKGETLQLQEDRLEKASPEITSKGYCLVGVDGYPLGWGKWLDGMLKNEYPAGWRWT